MNINHLNFVQCIHKSLQANERQLENLERSPHMVKLTYSGTDLDVAARHAIMEPLKEHYRERIMTAKTQLIQLGVDLSPLPDPKPDEVDEVED